MTYKIVLTGGGTAGHVIPNIALIELLQRDAWCVIYLGSYHGVEKNMINDMSIPYFSVSSGKLRRYFSWKNFTDPVKIIFGIIQAFWILHQIKPDVVFSKGGFVAFPVVVGAWLNRIPIVAHESDLTPGLANRLSFPFVNKICVTLAITKQYFKHQANVVVTGTPIRQALFNGHKNRGLAYCGFGRQKPCLLVIGGSQGAVTLNRCLREMLDRMCLQFQVIHLCGKGNIDKTLVNRVGYYQLEYAREELADFFAASDMVISRSGANSLYEILALGKPHILIPLSEKVSRGDQVQNARYFEKQGISTVINETDLSPERLFDAINDLVAHRDDLIKKIKALAIESASQKIVHIIKEQAHVQLVKTA